MGGTLPEIAASEKATSSGRMPEQPYVLVAQQSLFDRTRAPAGKHTLWAYCHTPRLNNQHDGRHETQIERFAPGFRDTVLVRAVHNSADYQRYNPNYVGGDINAGVQDLRQLWTRPVLRFPAYSTPLPGIYLCSASYPTRRRGSMVCVGSTRPRSPETALTVTNP